METRRILLRPVEENDYPTLFEWRNKDKFRSFVHYKDTRIDYDSFLKEFKRDAKFRRYQYVIVQKSTSNAIGLLFTHTFSEKHCYCFINIYIDETIEKLGYGIDAFALLYCYLFENDALHKIYVEVFDYNKFSISNILSAGLIEEGRFKGHKLYEGKRYDVIRFAGYQNLIPRFRKVLNHFSG